MEYRNGVLKDKSKAFAIRIIKLYQYLSEMKKEYVISKQLLRSGTAIGAMQREGEYAESKLDFIHKYARDTAAWMIILLGILECCI